MKRMLSRPSNRSHQAWRAALILAALVPIPSPGTSAAADMRPAVSGAPHLEGFPQRLEVISERAYAEEVSLLPVADTYVAEHAPTTAFGTADPNRILVETSPGGGTVSPRLAQGILRFPSVSGALPAGSTLLWARLDLGLRQASGIPSLSINPCQIEGSWNEPTVTWDTQPIRTSLLA